MPVKKTVYKINEIIAKEVVAGVPRYLAKYDHNSKSRWFYLHELEASVVKHFDAKLTIYNNLLRAKRLQKRNQNKKPTGNRSLNCPKR